MIHILAEETYMEVFDDDEGTHTKKKIFEEKQKNKKIKTRISQDTHNNKTGNDKYIMKMKNKGKKKNVIVVTKIC